VFRPSYNVLDLTAATTAATMAAKTAATAMAVTNQSIAPPTVSMFCLDQSSMVKMFLLKADLSTCIAICVTHMNEMMKNQQEHLSLKNDLMNHLWQNRSR
jgi:ABC-type xylose transport system permease subunit